MGAPLVRSTPELGVMLDRRRVRVPVPADLPMERRKEYLRKAKDQFISEEYRIDRAVYVGGMRLEAPTPHFDPHEPDTQVGDRGGTRPVARHLVDDISADETVDYHLSAVFAGPEYVSEIPTALATELFTQPGGRQGLRPLRGNEWRGIARGASRSN